MCGFQHAKSGYGDSTNVPTDNINYEIDQKIENAYSSVIQHDSNHLMFTIR